MGVSAPGGRTARPLPFVSAARPTPRFSVVFIDGNVRSALPGAGGQDSSGDGRSCLRFVGQVRTEPSFDLVERDSLPRRVVLCLVAADPADGEVARLRMREVDAADAGGGRRREGLRELDAELVRAEEAEEGFLLAVVGAGRVAVGGPDPAEALGDQLVVREPRTGLVPPPPRPLVEGLREC